MTRTDAHGLAFALLAIAGLAFTNPGGPEWVRWVGVCFAPVAIAAFIATAPRSH